MGCTQNWPACVKVNFQLKSWMEKSFYQMVFCYKHRGKLLSIFPVYIVAEGRHEWIRPFFLALLQLLLPVNFPESINLGFASSAVAFGFYNSIGSFEISCSRIRGKLPMWIQVAWVANGFHFTKRHEGICPNFFPGVLRRTLKTTIHLGFQKFTYINFK